MLHFGPYRTKPLGTELSAVLMTKVLKRAWRFSEIAIPTHSALVEHLLCACCSPRATERGGEDKEAQ